MLHLLVTGANGQVGSELRDLAELFPEWRFTFVDLPELDITDESSVNQFFSSEKFTYCINCAAYTAVDKAESEEALATAVNVEGPRNLARACKKNDAGLVQLSTDYVYHSRQNRPFREGDPTEPKGVYARTKLEGDIIAQKENPYTLVLRTSWVYSRHGNNFVKTMLRLGKERDELKVIFDQVGSPTSAWDLAVSIMEIIRQVETGETARAAFADLYHYSNEGVMSWYDFAKAIFEIKDISCRVLPIETHEYPTAAERPHFSLLNKAKIKRTFGLEIPYWRDSLKSCLEGL